MAEASTSGSGCALKRLRHELASLHRSPNPHIDVRSSDSDLLEWHFVLHSLPEDTPFHEGCYHGKISFPPEYPHAPPSLRMITPNGRLSVGMPICLTMTAYHPEQWSPAWTIETILMGLLSYLLSEEEGVGTVADDEKQRRALARRSWAFNAGDETFAALFPEFTDRDDFLAERAASSEDSDPRRPRPAAPQGGSKASPLLSGEGAELSDEPPESSEDQEMEEEPECWICRLPAGEEPLIQPCACRGSMSGVHRSCVEQWIAWRREVAVSRRMRVEPPRCAVCHEEYAGHQDLPSASALAWRCCTAARRHFLAWLRLLAAVAVLLLYVVAATGGLPPWAAALSVAAFSALASHHALVLMVSVPLQTALPPPQQLPLTGSRRMAVVALSALRQALTVRDAERLEEMTVQSVMGVLLLSLYFFAGGMPMGFVVPVWAATVLVAARSCSRIGRVVACVRSTAWLVGGMMVGPFLLFFWVGLLTYRHPSAAANPLGPGPHAVIAMVAVPLLILCCPSNVPIAAIIAAHTAVLFAGTFERTVVRRLQWQPGAFWWLVVYAAALGVYTSDVVFQHRIGEDGGGSKGVPRLPMMLLGSGWALALACLAMSVNCERILGAYRDWQQRYAGAFVLHVPAAGAVAREVVRSRVETGELAAHQSGRMPAGVAGEHHA